MMMPIRCKKKMVTGTFTHNYLAHGNLNNTHKNLQKCSKTFKPNVHNIDSTGTNTAKIWLSLYFMGCIRLAWYCGKMYSCHLFSYGGLSKPPKYYFCSPFDPLTPMLPITGCDEPWPLFHFWRHHLSPNLASFMLNFCRRKRSFQWYPDQGDWLNGAWNIHKNAQKVEWETQSKISCDYPCSFMVKIARLDDAFSESF